LAKTCFYCGKDLNQGERCDCRNAFNGNSSSNGSAGAGSKAKNGRSSDDTARKREQQKEFEREQAKAKKEREKREKERTKPKSSPFSWKQFLLRIMTNGSFASSDPLFRKIGHSFLQSIIRPVAAINSFVAIKDRSLSIFYLTFFSISSGILTMKMLGAGLTSFIEGAVAGLALALILNGLFVIIFKYFGKVRFSFEHMLSTFSVPSVFLSIFFLLASTGRTAGFSLLMSLITGIVIGALTQFVSLKAFTRQSTEQLMVSSILAYVVFFSIVGFILNIVVSFPVAK
jgi:hypothetical protein